MCNQRTHSTLQDKLPDKEAETRFQSLVTINGNDGYNFELTEDFKKAIKKAADEAAQYKLRAPHVRGAGGGGANTTAPAVANTSATAAATAAGGGARGIACSGGASTGGGGNSASHAALGTTGLGHSQAPPAQSARGLASSAGSVSSAGAAAAAPPRKGKWKMTQDSQRQEEMLETI